MRFFGVSRYLGTRDSGNGHTPPMLVSPDHQSRLRQLSNVDVDWVGLQASALRCMWLVFRPPEHLRYFDCRAALRWLLPLAITHCPLLLHCYAYCL